MDTPFIASYLESFILVNYTIPTASWQATPHRFLVISTIM